MTNTCKDIVINELILKSEMEPDRNMVQKILSGIVSSVNPTKIVDNQPVAYKMETKNSVEVPVIKLLSLDSLRDKFKSDTQNQNKPK